MTRRRGATGDAGTKAGRTVPESPNPPGLSGNRSVARWLRSDKGGAEQPERYIPAPLTASPASSLKPGLPACAGGGWANAILWRSEHRRGAHGPSGVLCLVGRFARPRPMTLSRRELRRWAHKLPLPVRSLGRQGPFLFPDRASELLVCGARGRIRTDDLPITRRMLGVGPDGSRRLQTDRLDDQSASDTRSDAKASVASSRFTRADPHLSARRSWAPINPEGRGGGGQPQARRHQHHALRADHHPVRGVLATDEDPLVAAVQVARPDHAGIRGLLGVAQ
jgi:hypothetical protein